MVDVLPARAPAMVIMRAVVEMAKKLPRELAEDDLARHEGVLGELVAAASSN